MASPRRTRFGRLDRRATRVPRTRERAVRGHDAPTITESARPKRAARGPPRKRKRPARGSRARVVQMEARVLRAGRVGDDADVVDVPARLVENAGLTDRIAPADLE